MRSDADHPAIIIQALGELRLWSPRFVANLVFSLSHHSAFQGVAPETIERGANALLDELLGVIALRAGNLPHEPLRQTQSGRHSVSLTRRQWMELALRMIDAGEHFLSSDVQAITLPILHRLTIAIGQLPPDHTRRRRLGKSFLPRCSSSTKSRPTPAGPG